MVHNIETKQLQLEKRDSHHCFGFQSWCLSLLVGYKIQPSSSSTNQNAALIIDHQLDFTIWDHSMCHILPIPPQVHVTFSLKVTQGFLAKKITIHYFILGTSPIEFPSQKTNVHVGTSCTPLFRCFNIPLNISWFL